MILFSIPSYDKSGDLKVLHPAELSEKSDKVALFTPEIGEQERLIGDNNKTVANDISQERTYISRSSKLQFLSHTVIAYLL